MDNENKYTPQILINSNPNIIGSVSKFNSQEEKVNIDIRSFLGEGNQNYANPLSEYDLIILDLETEANISEIRAGQLIKFLNTGKSFIYILRNWRQRQNCSNYFPIRALFGTENIFNTTEIGNKYNLTKEGKFSIWKEYLECKNKKYMISVISNYNDKIISFANNTEGNCIAFAHKEYKNNCFFIPWLEENKNIFGEIITKLAYNSLPGGEPVGEWVKKYTFHNLNTTIEKIGKLEEKIRKLEEEKTNEIIVKENLENIRNTLLYRNGNILKDVCKEVLNELGIKAEDGKIGREDLVFIHKNNHYVIEVKGATKSASKEHVKQLVSHIAEYKNENEVEPKGILLINPWRKLPIEERNTNDKPNFPNEIMNLVNISNLTLMTTQQLFVAYCEKLDNKFDLENFINSINKIGEIKILNNIEEYRS